MADIGMPKQWTEEQWSRVQQVVHDQALKTRVAARFLPLVGPLPPGTATVPAERVLEGRQKNGSDEIQKLEKRLKGLDDERRMAYEDLAIVLVQIAVARKKPSPAQQRRRQELSQTLADIQSKTFKALDELARLGVRAIGQSDESDGLGINDGDVLKLITVAVEVPLTTVQQSEPDLISSLTLFARAANIVARAEDFVIFQGKDPDFTACKVSPPPEPENSLLCVQKKPCNTIEIDCHRPDPQCPCKPTAEELVQDVAHGIAVLDQQGYLAPYALVLGKDLFVAAETPNQGGLVLPSDRIRPLIEGPLLRSGSLPDDSGVLVSLPGNPVEIVVASDIHVRFLQLTDKPRYLYRVSQRFVLRIKEPDAIVVLKPKDKVETQSAN